MRISIHRLLQNFFATHGNFFECFEAVGGEGGADDFNFFYSFFCKSLDGCIGVRLEPRIAPQSRLKGENGFFFGQSRFFDEGGHRFSTVLAVTSGLGGMALLTAVGRL